MVLAAPRRKIHANIVQSGANTPHHHTNSSKENKPKLNTGSNNKNTEVPQKCLVCQEPTKLNTNQCICDKCNGRSSIKNKSMPSVLTLNNGSIAMNTFATVMSIYRIDDAVLKLKLPKSVWFVVFVNLLNWILDMGSNIFVTSIIQNLMQN